jgi:ATP-dependent Lon protease
MSRLDEKINEHFVGQVVRKDLVKAVKGNAIVPSYVLEYLLGQYCATDDESSIESGIDTVKDILAKHYVHRNEAGLVRSTIREKGRYKVIDKIGVDLNDKDDVYEATFSNLGIKKVVVSSDTIKTHPKLLVGGVWCIADIQYQHSEEKEVPWLLDSIKPIQLSQFDFDGYVAARAHFTTDEWIDTLVQSIGFNPKVFDRRRKLLQLVRLIPFCERNYNVIELGPKGTGKSHIYSEFSPHGMLISGGEITVPKLFVNNSNGKLGLVGYWDCVAFDEFAGQKKKVDKALVDIMKNYMANKSFSRGVETLGAEASMAFVGNTQHTVEHMLRHSDLFDELPDKYHDSAFLDRLHFYIPGWEISIIRGEMFTKGFGFVVDYLAEILKSQRDFDFSRDYAPHFSLSENMSTRDRDAIHKTFSGLIKILYPHREATADELEELLRFAIEGRKRVKDQLMRIDQTYEGVTFLYTDQQGTERGVPTAEEKEYPDVYYAEGQEPTTHQAPTTNQEPEADQEPKAQQEPQTDHEPTPSPTDWPEAHPGEQSPAASGSTGEIFHGYELEQRFEAAGMAEVFRARKVGAKKPVFLKRVRAASGDKEALEREMGIYQKLSRIQTAHVLQVLDSIRDDEFIAIVTDFADGGDLEDYVKGQSGPGLTVGAAQEIGLAIAGGLKELHGVDVVHRDLKPRNVLRHGEAWMIADFGISKNLARVITQKTFQQYGTLGYAAPEQFDGVEAKPSADIYSLGKILVFLLSGQTDVDHITYPAWRDLIKRCVSTTPDERPTLSEAIESLESMTT